MKLSEFLPTRNAKVIGLTGGIASGKSTVAKILKGHGLGVVDADLLSKRLSQPGGLAAPAIEARFGSLDRQKIREVIMKDPAARKDLEAILHPLIRTQSLIEIEREFDQVEADPPMVFYEAALLIETGRAEDFDKLVVVHAPAEMRFERLTQREQIPSEIALALMNAQTSDNVRLKAAHYVIENSGDLGALRRNVETFLKKIIFDFWKEAQEN